MADTKKLTEYEIRQLTGRLSYASSAQRELVGATLRIVQEKRGGLSEGHVKDALRALVGAGLISDGVADSLLSKLND